MISYGGKEILITSVIQSPLHVLSAIVPLKIVLSSNFIEVFPKNFE